MNVVIYLLLIGVSVQVAKSLGLSTVGKAGILGLAIGFVGADLIVVAGLDEAFANPSDDHVDALAQNSVGGVVAFERLMLREQNEVRRITAGMLKEKMLESVDTIPKRVSSPLWWVYLIGTGLGGVAVIFVAGMFVPEKIDGETSKGHATISDQNHSGP